MIHIITCLMILSKAHEDLGIDIEKLRVSELKRLRGTKTLKFYTLNSNSFLAEFLGRAVISKTKI